MTEPRRAAVSAADRFEVTEEVVRGIPMTVYRNRLTSMGELFDCCVARYADRTHIIYGDERITFTDLAQRVEAVASGLAARGVGHGDRVAVLAANHPAWAETLWAAARLGAITVGLNGWWKAEELAHAIRDSTPTVLVIDRRRLETIEPLLASGLSIPHVLLIDGDERVAGATESYNALRAEATPAPRAEVDEDDPVVILYTSGTTGRSKGAVWTHRSVLAAIQSNAHKLALARVDAPALPPPNPDAPRVPKAQMALLVCVPMFHTSGLHAGVITALASGAKAVILHGRFRAEEVLRLVQEEQIVAWGAVPTMVLQVLDHPDRDQYDLSSLRNISYGGSPSSADLQERSRDAFGLEVKVGNAYGLTETTAAIMSIQGEEFLARPDSVGRPNPLVQVRIVDETGRELPTGRRGEITLKGPTIMAGYWQNPVATAESIRDGWFHTGDIGEMDDEGYVYIRDRAKDMVIRGGENVYCAEIEDRIDQHPEVVESAVIGVPHPMLGEEVKAIVRVREGSALTEDEVKSWASEALATFKVPAYVELVKDKLPRNPSGKILKDVLRGKVPPPAELDERPPAPWTASASPA